MGLPDLRGFRCDGQTLSEAFHGQSAQERHLIWSNLRSYISASIPIANSLTFGIIEMGSKSLIFYERSIIACLQIKQRSRLFLIFR